MPVEVNTAEDLAAANQIYALDGRFWRCDQRPSVCDAIALDEADRSTPQITLQRPMPVSQTAVVHHKRPPAVVVFHRHCGYFLDP